jgi:hypothetical protein
MREAIVSKSVYRVMATSSLENVPEAPQGRFAV